MNVENLAFGASNMINNKYYKLGDQPSAIRELYAYGLRRKAEIGSENVFDFTLGNPNVPSPVQVKKCLEKLIQIDPVQLHSYSMGNGLPFVRQAIADSIKKHHGFPASADHVFITSGAAGGLKATINAIVNQDEEIILISPYFPEYYMWACDAGVKVVEVPADSKTFQLDIDAIKNAIGPKTAAIMINSPNNPTGVIYSRQNLLDLSKVLTEAQTKFDKSIYIISDEPYRKITYDIDIPFVPEIYPNTIICDSASKSLSMPGERIGHVYVSDAADFSDAVYTAISGAARALGHVCAPVMFQRLYADCYDVPADIKPYKKNLKLITEKLDELGFEYVKPQGAFYLFMKSPIESAKEFSEFAKKFELLLCPSDTFGVKGWIRIGYCVSQETIVNSLPAWDRLRKELDKEKK